MATSSRSWRRRSPAVENGGRSRDGTWTMWRLKQGVVWHDGKPFTADDVIFTWEFATDPATAATSRGLYDNIRRIDKLDELTIKVVFTDPTPVWYISGGPILPKHLFAEYTGQNARNAPYNLKPVGTGPYKIVDFKPGDVALYEINPHYHVPNRPFFDTVELKGGGDAHKRELKHMNHDSQDQHGLPVKWCCETITTIFRRVPCWSKAMIPTVLSSDKRYPSWGTPGRRRSCRVCLPTSPSRPGPSRPCSACEVWRPRTTSCGACWPMSWGPCRRAGWAPGRY